MVGNTPAADEDSSRQYFSFSTVEIATDYFSDANKLGEGGYGAVYKVLSHYLQHIFVTQEYTLWPPEVQEPKRIGIIIMKKDVEAMERTRLYQEF